MFGFRIRVDQIGHKGVTYMRRWVLFTPIGTARVHHTLAPDERCFHDHPWAFVSLVVRGWYNERHPDTTATLRLPGSLALRGAREMHYIDDVSPGGCWTFLLTDVKRRDWGFVFGDLEWVNWRDGADRAYGVGDWT